MNRVRFLTKIAFTASVSLALAFTLSCSSDSNDGGGDSSKPIVYNESYTLKEVTGSSFTYVETDEEYSCRENGVLDKRDNEYDRTINYSLTGNVLTWYDNWSDDKLDFTGSSSNLYGTWTRTKNKSVDCEIRTDEYDGDQWYSCKSNWRITKAVFKENPSKIEITTDYCATDYIVEESERRGYKYRNLNCNSYELYKGSSVITYKGTESGYTISYGSKSCTYKQPTSAMREQACKDAWTKHVASGDSYFSSYSHEDLLYEDFNKCEENILPTDWLNYYNEKVSAKILTNKELFFNAKRNK